MNIPYRTFIFVFSVWCISMMQTGLAHATHFTEVPDNYERVTKLLSRGVCDEAKTRVSQYATWGNTGYILYRIKTHSGKIFYYLDWMGHEFYFETEFYSGGKEEIKPVRISYEKFGERLAELSATNFWEDMHLRKNDCQFELE